MLFEKSNQLVLNFTVYSAEEVNVRNFVGSIVVDQQRQELGLFVDGLRVPLEYNFYRRVHHAVPPALLDHGRQPVSQVAALGELEGDVLVRYGRKIEEPLQR